MADPREHLGTITPRDQPLPKPLRARRSKPFAFRGVNQAEQLHDFVRVALKGIIVEGARFLANSAHGTRRPAAALAHRLAGSLARHLRHLLIARPLLRRGESEVGQRATDRRSLGVLQTGDLVDLTATLELACPSYRGGLGVSLVPIDAGFEITAFSVTA